MRGASSPQTAAGLQAQAEAVLRVRAAGDEETMTAFHRRSLLWIASAALCVGAALFAAALALHRRSANAGALEALEACTRQVEALERDAQHYREIAARLGLQPGGTLRREPLDVTATYRADQVERIEEMLAAAYGSGVFSLDALTIEEPRAGFAPADAAFVRVMLKGEKLLAVGAR